MTRQQNCAAQTALPVHSARRLATALASLRLAIGLLSMLTVCLIGATWLESAYDAGTAQELVYRTWWFALLLTLLAVNVLGAALKKYPWRRHQTGFLVTHAGLLVLLTGGLLTTLFGIEGQMILVDTPSAAAQARIGLGNSSNWIYLERLHQIDVFRLRGLGDAPISDAARLIQAVDAGQSIPAELRRWVDGEWRFFINPGVFTWFSDDCGRRRLPWALDLLDRLAVPAPGFHRSLDSSTALTVANFYPQVEADWRQPLGFFVREGHARKEEVSTRTSALRCTLSAGTEREEFGVAQFRGAARIRLAGAWYLVRYRPAARELDFSLTLKHAWQVKDPGSDRPAWFQSDVVLATAASDAEARNHSVSMNRPLGHGLYKVFQARYQRLTESGGEPVLDGERPVSLAGLAVAYDPGLWLKYAGSLLVVAGIATMFWMRAYFFQPRGRKP